MGPIPVTWNKQRIIDRQFYETGFAFRVFKVLCYTFVKTNVVTYFTLFPIGNRCPFTVTTNYPTIEILFVAQRFKVLQESYTK